jgi:hypothetical protein
MTDQDSDEEYQKGREPAPGASRRQRGKYGLMDPPLPDKPWKAVRSALVAIMVGSGAVMLMCGFTLGFWPFPCEEPDHSNTCQAHTLVGPVVVWIAWHNSYPFKGELTVSTCTGGSCTQVYSSGSGNGSYSVWVPDLGIVEVNPPANIGVNLSSSSPGYGLPFFVIGSALIGVGIVLRRFRRRMSVGELAQDIT